MSLLRIYGLVFSLTKAVTSLSPATSNLQLSKNSGNVSSKSLFFLPFKNTKQVSVNFVLPATRFTKYDFVALIINMQLVTICSSMRFFLAS